MTRLSKALLKWNILDTLCKIGSLNVMLLNVLRILTPNAMHFWETLQIIRPNCATFYMENIVQASMALNSFHCLMILLSHFVEPGDVA